jgi:hypothetical protein
MKKITTIILAVLFTANLMAQVPNYVPTNGLVAWYPFTGNAIDSSGNGNNGTVNGATLSTDRFGNANKAYSFDGIDDYIQIIYNLSLTSKVGTISTWIKSNGNINNDQRLIYGQGQGRPTICVNSSNNRKARLQWHQQLNGNPNGWAMVTSTSNIDNSQWINIVGVYDTSNLSIYINGILEATYSSSYNQWNCSQYNFHIGAFNATSIACGGSLGISQAFNGKIDDIGIWNRALNQDEITALYSGCVNNLLITPVNNNKTIGTNAIFTASVSDPNPSYIWQIDFGQGFQTLNNFGNYSGTSTNSMSISNVQLSNHMEPIRAITTSGSCKDTSNIAYVKITDTCITKINDTIKITKYDTITTKITKYDTIKVMDTLVINANLSGISAPNNTNRIIVYPNPAKDHITIDYGVFSRMSGYTVKITNTLGQTVFTSPINQQSSFINLSTWTGKGLYYLQIIDPNSNMIENRKIVLQ